MFLIPYLYKETKHNTMNIYSIQLLTIGGTSLWEEDSKLRIDEDILQPNDLYRKGNIATIHKHNHILQLCEIDSEKTKIDDFYQWKELSIADDSTFCWKPFFHVVGEKNECWLPIPANETIGKIKVQFIIQSILDSKLRKEVI